MDNKATLQRALEELTRRRAEIEALRREKTEPIAVIGMACRFPGGSPTPADFWNLLDRGGDAVTEVPGGRWNPDAFYDPDPAAAGKMATKCGAFIEHVDQFDPQFFGISPREALTMDPQQRVLLEVTWEALENANIAPTSLYGSATGVYIGITCFDHALRMSQSIENFTSYSGTGSALNMAPGRISYVLGLTGPSMAVDTACSSALVCLHLACQSLRQRETEMALAGGVHLMLSPDVMVSFSQARMLASDGRSKTFDASADGYSRGEGCGVIVLKRLSDALANGDSIAGLIRGTAVNQDGPSGGLTVPNGASQQKVIMRALEAAGLAPNEIGYVEAHGTGTSLGDPIEVEALANVYGKDRDPSQPLLIGSVKTNIGHLEPAAGMAGLIKILLAFQNERIPRHLHFRNPSPHIPWKDLPLKVADEHVEWPKGQRRRIAGLSAFGFSGTNAHVIIEEPPPAQAGGAIVDSKEDELHLLTMSAKSEEALKELTARYHNFLGNSRKSGFASVCYSAGNGRAHFAHRIAVLAANVKDARSALEAFITSEPCANLFHGKAASRDYRDETTEIKSRLDLVYGQLRSSEANRKEALQEAAKLYIEGCAIDWKAIYGSLPPVRAVLPNYPFQRRRYWVETSSEEKPDSPDALNNSLYRIIWEQRDPGGKLSPPDTGRRWVVIPGEASLASAVERLLSERGAACVLASAGDAAKEQATDLLYLGPNCGPLLELVHHLLGDRKPAPRIWIATRGATAARKGPGLDGVAQSPMLGFAKVLSLEHPELFGRLIDLDPDGSAAADARSLITEILHESVEDQVALRRGARYVPRIERHGAGAPLGSAIVRPDASYLITGGLGVLGLHVARWLATRGARHLYLLGRHGISSPVQQRAIGEIEALGAGVHVITADVADAARMSGVFQDLAQGAPLRGIVHAAGMPGYVDIQTLGEDEMDAVMRPKVQGAWLLHELTREMHLDFFVCFSSIASAWGSRGQAHYAAANSFLDALAHHRRTLGLPAVSINWGPWLDGGMTSREMETLLRRVGIKPLLPERAIQALEKLACSDLVQPIVADVDWNLFKGSYEARGHRPLLEHLKVTPASAAGASSNNELLDQFHAMPAAGREDFLIGVVENEVKQVLALDNASRPDPQQGLFEMGMDSLMALELRTRLEARVSHALPATLAFDCPDIRSIAQFLLNEVLTPGTAPLQPAARQAQPARQDREPISQSGLQIDLENISEADAEDLLLKKLEALK